MQIKEMLANSSNDTKGRKQNIQYIVVHYTANNENRAESNGKYFQQSDKNQVQWLDFKGKLGEKKGEETEMTYNYIDKNMLGWARPTIQKLVNKGYLNGNEKGELGLNDTMLKIFVVNDRAGMYGE